MGAPFDVFSFANDVGKGVGGLVKGAADVAAGAVGIAANLVEGAASELTGANEHPNTPELPEARYRDSFFHNDFYSLFYHICNMAAIIFSCDNVCHFPV